MSPASLEVDDPRATRAGSGTPAPHPFVLFDGVCNLCDATVQWILRHDRRGVFRFAPLQSRAAAAALDGVPSGARPDSIVLVDERGRHIESEAVIRIAQRLGGPWTLAPVARVLPRGARDAMYRWVARNRYRWFDQRVPAQPLIRGLTRALP